MVPKGVYAPLITPFNADQSIDFETFKRHVQYVAGAGGERRRGVSIVLAGLTGANSCLCSRHCCSRLYGRV